MISQISVTELSEKLKSDEVFVLLDVRELPELAQAKIDDPRLEVAPLSRLSLEGPEMLSEAVRSKETPVYIICHHGNRSMQATMWLLRQGFLNVSNVTGGIYEYAQLVDESVGTY